MSDPKHVDPEAPTSASDGVAEVVESANEALAEAEAASRDAVPAPTAAEAWDAEFAAGGTVSTHPEPADDDPVTGDAEDTGLAGEAVAQPVSAAGVTAAADVPTVEVTAADVPAVDAAADPDPAATVVAPVALTPPAASLDDAATLAYPAPAVDSGPPETALMDAPSPQPIFVQAPEAPRPRGNRGAAGAIGLLAAVSFAVLYLGAALGFGAIAGEVTVDTIGTFAVSALTSWWLWVPVAVFFLAFWLLGAIINRGRWGHWVIFGLLVGAASYGGHLLGQMFQAPFWSLTAAQGAVLVEGQLLAPLAVAALVIGRELTIWFGAWVAARGTRVTELNTEAQREYERTLEAGPQLHRS
ncbi:ABC transporter [Microbacterium sp.]|uniref:ABC transporter n=1 Tax=Microbacterium sp. TaxID=51671 RepID=UPI003A840FCE